MSTANNNNNTNNSDDDNIALVRSEAAQRLKELQEKAEALESPPPSWLARNSDGDAADANNSESDATDNSNFRHLNYAGFVKLSNFCTVEECQAMKAEMGRLVRDEWHPNENGVDDFGTNAQQNEARGDYFLASADTIHYFCEPAASMEEETDDGSTTKRKVLKPEFQSDDNKIQALNKAGHALHCVEYFDDAGAEGGTNNSDQNQRANPFYQYCTSDKIRTLVHNQLQYKDPVVPQSMYIFKAPHVGGTVGSHQDSTFLWTEPRQSCLGLWLALDDATLQNGCLWVRPQSHDEPVHRQYKRNPRHFGQNVIDQRQNLPEGNVETESKFVMEDCVSEETSSDKENDDNKPAKPASLPLDTMSAHELWTTTDYVPVECQAGDLLVFVGTLDHLSLPNTSAAQRHTFQLHLVEGPKAGVTWSPYNWLQYPPGKPFLRLVNEEGN